MLTAFGASVVALMVLTYALEAVALVLEAVDLD